ncbi:hypothetical protein MKX03_029435 [Papaver bracteatum]|nr:hypothetical protein MKX03_029435 [Papaver bracteatum]
MDIDEEKKGVFLKREKIDVGLNQCMDLVPVAVTEQPSKYALTNDYDVISIYSEEDMGRSTDAGLSTCKRNKIAFNDTYPSNSKTKIVHFSTKRSGEIGRLHIEWTKCVTPLVNSARVKLCGRIVVAAPQTYMSALFVEGDKTSWNLTPSHVESIYHPLPTLFQLMRITAFKKGESVGVLPPLVPIAKKTRGSQSQQVFEQANDEQTFSELTLNNLVSAADVCSLEMFESEEGTDVQKAAKTLHPCWEVILRWQTGERASEFYVNAFSGEATAQFPSATQTTRGGCSFTVKLLAGATGLGKTAITIALIPARQGRGTPYLSRSSQATSSAPKVKGGTLIICPMALLGRWKDELEAHSQPGTLRFMYNTMKLIQSNPQVAQTAFSLSSYCRWCLTGTPLQNNLEDPYSFLCFLHVESWCNWGWLVKSILRSLMPRRTKDTRVRKGRPILVILPADMQVIECKQSDAERDFYSALFKRSKIHFDQFIAQGKVLHNYASSLELLPRLRQCCNHPYLLMIRFLNKLAMRFLGMNANADNRGQICICNGENTGCPICLESADDPVLTPYAHRMCRECLFTSWGTSAGGSCPICRQKITKDELITCPSDNNNNLKDACKVSKLLDCLENIQKSGSGEKSIIFRQWTSFFNLIYGKLNQKNGEKVLKELNETKKKMVLLMSLKPGGVRLNSTAASNLFLMIPAVEVLRTGEQAFMRIDRIGQKRIVRDRRLVVDTVEERLHQVQARKQCMIAGAVTDEEVRSARIEELKMLFR